MNVSATILLQAKTAAALKVAFDPYMFQDFPTSELLQADPGVDVQPNVPYGVPTDPLAHHLATHAVRANANIPLVLSPKAYHDAVGQNIAHTIQAHGYPESQLGDGSDPARADAILAAKYQIRDMAGYDDPAHPRNPRQYDVDTRARESLMQRQGPGAGGPLLNSSAGPGITDADMKAFGLHHGKSIFDMGPNDRTGPEGWWNSRDALKR